MIDNANWSEEWPTVPGCYWLYGHMSAYSREHGKPRMMLVDVRVTGNGRNMYVANGSFLYEVEGCGGYWTKAEVPSPPVGAFQEDGTTQCLKTD